MIADKHGAFLLRGLERGVPTTEALAAQIVMLTSGEPNDLSSPRIARHLPKFTAADFAQWGDLLADRAPPWESALNIPELGGFGTVCSSLLSLPYHSKPHWRFAGGAPHAAAFETVALYGHE